MNANNIYEFSAGGVAGDVIGQAMLPYFNKLGTTLFFRVWLHIVDRDKLADGGRKGRFCFHLAL